MDDYSSQRRKSSNQLVGIGLVVVVHVLILWVVNSGLARSFVKKIQKPVEAVLLEEKKPELPPPPPPPPAPVKNVPPPPVFVPPSDVQVSAPTTANAISAVTSTPTPVVVAPVVNTPPPVRTPAVVNSANCVKPEYPSASKRLEEEGTVNLRFLIGIDGKVLEASIEKSSGYRRLDEAAREGLSRCQFTAATVGGKPEQAWATMKYTWRLD
jgi:protein TonB